MICFRNEYPVYSSLLIFEFFTHNDYRLGDKSYALIPPFGLIIIIIQLRFEVSDCPTIERSLG